MNLTNAIREEIIRDVIFKTFEKDEKELKKREDKIGRAAYNKLYSTTERELAAKLPQGWVKQDDCLKFNIAGMNMNFNLLSSLPVKTPVEYCARLGNISDEKIKQDALDLHADKERLAEKKNKLRGQLHSVLYGVNTYKRLCETWPEGLKFYSKYKPKGENSLLPAIRVNELNETLGLKAKA